MQPATSSDLLSADTAVVARRCLLRSLVVLADGTNAATVTIYDNATSAAGKVLAKVIVDAGLTYESFSPSEYGVEASNGLFADVSGTGAAYIVYYGLE